MIMSHAGIQRVFRGSITHDEVCMAFAFTASSTTEPSTDGSASAGGTSTPGASATLCRELCRCGGGLHHIGHA